MSRKWYEIKNTAADSAEVFIYDEIGGWGISASQFVRDLKPLAGKALTVRIHSPGGSVLDGHAIYNALARHAGGVTVKIDGLAASMASVIAMAGAPVKMAANGFLMIHNPSSIAIGESGDMRKAADLMDKMKDGLVNIYARKSGRDADEIEQWMDDETWFTAAEAMEHGLIDEITDDVKAVAKFDALKNFGHVPPALVDTHTKEMQTLDTLSAELSTAREQLSAAQSQAQTNFASFTELSAKHTAALATLTQAQTDLSAAAEANATLTSELEAARKISAIAVNAEAARVLASAGHAPIALGAGQSGATINTMTRAEFDALDSTKRAEFMRSGGKLTA